MRKYNVIFEIFNGAGQKFMETVSVEAGNKRLAVIRAMNVLRTMNHGQYEGSYKQVTKVEEVA